MHLVLPVVDDDTSVRMDLHTVEELLKMVASTLWGEIAERPVRRHNGWG